MIRPHFRTFALFLAAGFALSGCKTMDSVEAGMKGGYMNVRQALQDFRPFDDLNAIAPAAGTAKASLNPASLAQCPDVRIVQDLNQVHQFIDAASPAPEESVSSIRMVSMEDRCTVTDGNLAIDITIAFEALVGPKGRSQPGDRPSFAYPYFIAITDRHGRIIGKEVFAVTMAYDQGRDHETHTEQLRQMIPAAGDSGNYKILIGFQLSDQELAYNRALPEDQKAATPTSNVTTIEPAAGN